MGKMAIGLALIMFGLVVATHELLVIPYLLIILGVVLFVMGDLDLIRKNRKKTAQGKSKATSGKTQTGNTGSKTEIQQEKIGKDAVNIGKSPISMRSGKGKHKKHKEKQQGKPVGWTSSLTATSRSKSKGEEGPKVGPFYQSEVCSEKLSLYGSPVKKGVLKDGTEWEVVHSNFGLCLVLVGSGEVTGDNGKAFDVETGTQLGIVNVILDPWDLSDELKAMPSRSLVDPDDIYRGKLDLENLAVDERITSLPLIRHHFERKFVLTVIDGSETAQAIDADVPPQPPEMPGPEKEDFQNAEKGPIAEKQRSPGEIERQQQEEAKAALRRTAEHLPEGLPVPGEYSDGGHYAGSKDAKDWYWVLDTQDTLWLLGRGELPSFCFTGFGCGGTGEDTEECYFPWFVSEEVRLDMGSDRLVSFSLFDMTLSETRKTIRTLVLSREAQLTEGAYKLIFLLKRSEARTYLLPASMKESIEKASEFTFHKDVLSRIRYYQGL